MDKNILNIISFRIIKYKKDRWGCRLAREQWQKTEGCIFGSTYRDECVENARNWNTITVIGIKSRETRNRSNENELQHDRRCNKRNMQPHQRVAICLHTKDKQKVFRFQKNTRWNVEDHYGNYEQDQRREQLSKWVR